MINDYFIDLHIVNNKVVSFFKTRVVKYKDTNGNDVSYLFPTTFVFNNGQIQTSMVFGSVARNFKLTRKINGTGTDTGTELSTISVESHLYKLLVANQFVTDPEYFPHIKGVNRKSFICIIEDLERIGFPFMRIAL